MSFFRAYILKKKNVLFTLAFIFNLSLFAQSWTVKNEDEAYTARHECSFVQAGDKFILFGGRENAQTLDVYDYTSDTWSNGGMAPVEFNHMQAISHEGLIWVIGAFKTNNFPNELSADYIYMYNPATEKWIQGMEIPASRKRGAGGLVNYNGSFYLVGGNTIGHNGGYVTYFDEFNPNTGVWTQLTDAPNARDHFQAVTFGDKLYAIGGRLTGGTGGTFEPQVPEVDVYDLTTQMWSTLDVSKNLPFPRAGLAVTVFNNEIYTIAGESTFDNPPGVNNEKDVVESFDPITETWTPQNSLNYPRHGMQSIVSGNAIYIVGGYGGGGPRKLMEYYGTDNPVGSPSVNSTFAADESTKSFLYTELQGTAPIQITLSNTIGTTGTYIDTIELTGSTDYTLLQSYDNRLVGVNGNLMVDVTLNDTTKPTNDATLVVTYNNNLTINVSLEGTLDGTFSVEDKNIRLGKLFPNPVRNNFSINKDITRLSIYNIAGKLVKEYKGNFNKGELFDVSRLPQSLYFTKIEDISGMIMTSKLVKL